MIRPLALTDVERLKIINEENLGYVLELDKTRRQLTKLLADEQHILLGFADDQTDILLGYIHAQIYETLYADTGLNVLGLAVDASVQGQGIGRKLLSDLEKRAKDMGLAFIRLNSGSHRHLAHQFYSKLGYDGQKTQKRFIKYL